MQRMETMVFADWFPAKKGFVGIRPEYAGTAVYQYRSENDVKRHWFADPDIALALYEELRFYLETRHL